MKQRVLALFAATIVLISGTAMAFPMTQAAPQAQQVQQDGEVTMEGVSAERVILEDVRVENVTIDLATLQSGQVDESAVEDALGDNVEGASVDGVSIEGMTAEEITVNSNGTITMTATMDRVVVHGVSADTITVDAAADTQAVENQLGSLLQSDQVNVDGGVTVQGMSVDSISAGETGDSGTDDADT